MEQESPHCGTSTTHFGIVVRHERCIKRAVMTAWGPNLEQAGIVMTASCAAGVPTAGSPRSAFCHLPEPSTGRWLLCYTQPAPQPSWAQTCRACECWIQSFSPPSLLSISALTPLSFISFSKDTFRDETIHNCLSTDSLWQHNWQWVCCKNENAVLITLA